VAVKIPDTVTLSGRPTVTVPFDLETLTSALVPLTARTAPLALFPRVTAPEETSKSSLSKDAIPLLDAVASSAAIVIVSLLTVVSIPSPPVKVSVPPVLKVSSDPESAAIVKLEAAGAENDRLPEPSLVRTSPLSPSSAGIVSV